MGNDPDGRMGWVDGRDLREMTSCLVSFGQHRSLEHSCIFSSGQGLAVTDLTTLSTLVFCLFLLPHLCASFSLDRRKSLSWAGWMGFFRFLKYTIVLDCNFEWWPPFLHRISFSSFAQKFILNLLLCSRASLCNACQSVCCYSPTRKESWEIWKDGGTNGLGGRFGCFLHRRMIIDSQEIAH